MSYLQFGLYFFIFLLSESVVNERAADVFNASSVNYIYAVGLIFTALGYIVFSLFYKKSNKITQITAPSVTILALIGMMTVNAPLLYLFCSYLCLISLGYIGGHIHYQASLNLHSKNHALYLGICSALGIFAQYIVQNIGMPVNEIILTSIISTFILSITTLFSRKVDVATIPNTVSYESGISIKTRILVYISSVAIMSIVLGFQDSIIVAKNATGELHLFSYVRLFYALGLLIAGLIANIRERVYLPLASGCAMTLSVLAISFLGNTNPTYNISMSIMYFYCGFYVMFMTIMFMELGLRKSNPWFYAGFGRVTRSIVTCLIVLLTTLFSGVSTTVYTVLSCVLSITLLVIMSLSGILIPEKTLIKEVAIAPSDMPLDEKFNNFFTQYSLTPKEQEVFVKLVTTEMGVQEIADELFISRRMLQRHIASIYEKTGTQTRVGLLILLR